MHMQGAQYAYKIKYDDINSLFLLPRLDGRMAFVIALDKPIRQGNQKYQNLVLETHEAEHTTLINLSEEEIAEKYDGLSQEMTLPMSTLIAKIFKILSQKKVGCAAIQHCGVYCIRPEELMKSVISLIMYFVAGIRAKAIHYHSRESLRALFDKSERWASFPACEIFHLHQQALHNHQVRRY